MKKALQVMALLIMVAMVSGCGKEREIENQKVQSILENVEDDVIGMGYEIISPMYSTWATHRKFLVKNESGAELILTVMTENDKVIVLNLKLVTPNIQVNTQK